MMLEPSEREGVPCPGDLVNNWNTGGVTGSSVLWQRDLEREGSGRHGAASTPGVQEHPIPSSRPHAGGLRIREGGSSEEALEVSRRPLNLYHPLSPRVGFGAHAWADSK
ncbi:hypothetical protein PF005_g23376 [Phytophthora fragariae]|uniref:Uncharacterized protein n=1 Tax=Phytophthora fragariae TaxID=53985 RepID=A0A6A3WHV9_9STRA|nr:hypothetical protein PF005_g23376 [Phytophthora fragariae]KAE9194753.1 hypothetical protein PF002_g23508 [Phytophthora fragariae]KAE9290286.1 hypothetical protein PF001_g19669 [Phytophthora fragariae]